MSLTPNATPEELRQAWQELKTKEPRLYTRDAAKKLGVSEAHLIALGVGDTSFRLKTDDLFAFFEGFAAFGESLFLVRNEAAVLEKDAVLKFEDKGAFLSANGTGTHLAFAKASIAHGFVVHAGQYVKRGAQFFDAAGNAVVKAYIRDESKIPEFDGWAKQWFAADQSPAFAAQPAADAAAGHHPHGHGHSCGCSGGDGAHAHGHCGSAKSAPVALPPHSFKTLLEAAVKSGESVTVTVANGHALLSVTAPVFKLSVMGPWFNILDKELHMHLGENAVKSAAAVTDPAAKTLTATFKDEAGKPVVWMRVASDGAAAAELGKL
jgi:putative hemin transport protein